MDAASQAPQRSPELAELRRRAYGPDADIQRDPDALRRLHELEELDRVVPPDPAADPAVDARSVVRPELPRSESAAASTVEAAADLEPAASVAGSTQESRSWWRRVPPWAAVAAIGLIGVGLGLAVASAAAPRSDFTLRPNDTAQVDLSDEMVQSMFAWVDIQTPPVEYQAFQKLRVLSATAENGTTCLVVMWPNQWSNVNCTPEGLPPVVDFVAYVGAPQPLGRSLPIGTVIRFELHDGVVEVTVREPTDQTSAEAD